MKCLFIVTGRGLGGDAMTALNAMKGLEKKGVQCEVALDASAHGTLFEKHGYKWHKISVPHAGGHSATKLSALKGGVKLLTATFKARSLIKKLKVDFVVGVLGGGAIVASLGGKVARKPTFSLISTPLDSKVCPKFNQCYILPELNMFRWEQLPKNTSKLFYPLADNMGDGDEAFALQKLKEYPNFDENKKTIVFSSGSSIFKGMIDAINIVADKTDEYNLVLVGLPLKDEYYDLIDEDKIIYAGYIDWINHLFKFADLTVLTDDGVSLEEAFTNGKPIVALARVKWGRYQNMAGVFKGAMIESSVEDVCESIDEAFRNYEPMRQKALVYGQQCMDAADDLAVDILKKVNK
ncbi:MAG: glycosyltransferase [Methanobrevibacter sp.]|nr:glycosyltransferase [Methanobrevibacter sp.]